MSVCLSACLLVCLCVRTSVCMCVGKATGSKNTVSLFITHSSRERVLRKKRKVKQEKRRRRKNKYYKTTGGRQSFKHETLATVILHAPGLIGSVGPGPRWSSLQVRAAVLRLCLQDRRGQWYTGPKHFPTTGRKRRSPTPMGSKASTRAVKISSGQAQGPTTTAATTATAATTSAATTTTTTLSQQR